MKRGVDVIKFMDHGNQPFPKGKHEEPGNTKGQMVKDFRPIQKKALDLVDSSTALSSQTSPLKPQWGNARLEAINRAFAIPYDVEDQTVGIDVVKLWDSAAQITT